MPPFENLNWIYYLLSIIEYLCIIIDYILLLLTIIWESFSNYWELFNYYLRIIIGVIIEYYALYYQYSHRNIVCLRYFDLTLKKTTSGFQDHLHWSSLRETRDSNETTLFGSRGKSIETSLYNKYFYKTHSFMSSLLKMLYFVISAPLPSQVRCFSSANIFSFSVER